MTMVNRETKRFGQIIDDPAFPYKEGIQRGIYVREPTWKKFKDTIDAEVSTSLEDAGFEDVDGRELHEAALAVVLQYPLEIALKVVENRCEAHLRSRVDSPGYHFGKHNQPSEE